MVLLGDERHGYNIDSKKSSRSANSREYIVKRNGFFGEKLVL